MSTGHSLLLIYLIRTWILKNEQLRRQNRFVLVLILAVIILALGIHHFFNQSLQPVAVSDQRVVKVTIPKGATDHEVAQIMKSHQLVRSQYVFYYYLQTHKTAGVKAGKFKLRRSSSVPQLVDKLQQNQAAKKR